MKKTKTHRRVFLPAFLAVFCLAVLFPVKEEQVLGADRYVVDEAGLLGDADLGRLEEECALRSDEYEMDFAVATTADKQGKKVFDYVYDYYMDSGYGYDEPGGDGFALLIDMEDRNVYILSRGRGARWISNSELADMSGEIASYLSGEDYAGGCMAYLDLITKRLSELQYVPGTEPPAGTAGQAGSETDGYRGTEGYRGEGSGSDGGHKEGIPVFAMIVGALVLGAVTTGIGLAVFRGTDRNTSQSRSYRVGNAVLTDRRDIFLRRTETRTPRTDNKNNGGRPGFGGHGGAGGGSFGGSFNRSTGGGGSKF